MKIVLAIAALAAGFFAQEAFSQDATRRQQVASGFTQAKAIHPEYWVTSADRERSGSYGEGVAYFELTVSPAGDIEQCRILESSGFDVFDSLTCSLIQERGHFRPALDQSGQPVASTWVNRVRWARPGHNWEVPPRDPDILLTVTKLPEHVTSPAYVNVFPLIGPDGHVEACEGSIYDKAPEVLKDVACKQVGAELPNLISTDKNGERRPILRSLLVEFATDPSGTPRSANP